MINRFLLAGVSAALLWCTYPPVGLPYIVFIALVPLFVCSRRLKPLQSALVWGVGGLLFNFANLSWFFTLREHNVGWEYILPGWCVGSLIKAFIFALFGLLDAYIWRCGDRERPSGYKWLVLFLTEPFIWTGLEWVRSQIPGLEWNYIGTAICQMPLLSASARWGGEIMSGALAIMVNSTLATVFENFSVARQKEATGSRISFKPFKELFVVLGVVTLIFVVSKLAVPDVETETRKFVMVQRYAPLEVEMDELKKQGFDSLEYYKDLLNTYDLKGADFVVLPESSLKEFGMDVRAEGAWNVAKTLSDMADGASVIAGGESNTPSPRGRYIQTAAALYEFPRNSRAKDPPVYIKRNLVPFGEYNPLAKWFPSLRTLSYYVEAPGTKTGVFHSKGITLSPLICFDCSSSEYARDAAEKGVQIFVLISNNLWYTPSAEPMQHFWQAVSRAVETGLPLVCAGNAGVTGAVDSDGSVKMLKDGNGAPLQCAPGVFALDVKVPKKYKKTPYVLFGDFPLLGLFALSFVSLIVIKT